ncbi:hypothetical protein M404DRAFT_35070 [Pisolithus tinctorius Marx 270]|uniref:Uncharacterized protein n=1 Tax=Pisolithus tinctorius Marx 270 TaxID=870435 RepID=A0A0C3IBK4_PISTI|nr:hypothetical protein M404DRAFT_35070 [Pisolithus tinctorius Marx 270]
MGKVMTVEKARRGRARTPTPGRYYGPPKRYTRKFFFFHSVADVINPYLQTSVHTILGLTTVAILVTLLTMSAAAEVATTTTEAPATMTEDTVSMTEGTVTMIGDTVTMSVVAVTMTGGTDLSRCVLV